MKVSDSGPGLASEGELHEGVGLSNCRERLHRLYGEEQRFELRNAPQGGLVVELEIPFRTTAAVEVS